MNDRQIILIAGPNGAGKTTFVEVFLPDVFDVPLFVNADKIASGFAPFQPESEAILAGKLMLKQIDKYVGEGLSFAFETTLSGRGYAKKIEGWRGKGPEAADDESVSKGPEPGGQGVDEHVGRRAPNRGEVGPCGCYLRRHPEGVEKAEEDCGLRPQEDVDQATEKEGQGGGQKGCRWWSL